MILSTTEEKQIIRDNEFPHFLLSTIDLNSSDQYSHFE